MSISLRGVLCQRYNFIFNMGKIRIGVIGCASIAKRLMLPAINAMPDYMELVAVASRTKDKADEFSALFDCDGVVGYDRLLSRQDIDAVYIPLPTGLHKEWIVKALSNGKHVYAEKSIAMNEHEAREMVELAKSRGLALMEGYMFQYHTQHKVVKQILADGVLGTPRLIRASFGFPPFLDSENFRYDNQIGGGALKDAAGYVLRCVNFLFDNTFTVKASNVYYDSSCTSIYGTVFLTAGSELSAEISFGFDNYYQCNYEIWGSLGKLTCIKAFTPKPNEETHVLIEKQGFKDDIAIPPFNHFASAMKEFCQICENKDLRDKHYNDIVFQSNGLDIIEKLSKHS